MEKTMSWVKKNWVVIAITLGVILLIYYYSRKKGAPAGQKVSVQGATTTTASAPTSQKDEKMLAEETAKWANDTLSKTKSFEEFKAEAAKLGYSIIQDREPEMGGFDPTRIRVATSIGMPAPNKPMQKMITSIISIG